MNDILGLQRGTVVLKKHHKEWKEVFDHEKAHLKTLLEDLALDIQHIGSTAVPDLAAKPLLDMLLAVRNIETDVQTMRPLLENIGYMYRKDGPNDDVRRLFMKGPEENRTHHLHVTERGSTFWKQSLAFRDWLRSHPEDARQYELLKEELVRQYADTRELYTSGKYKFIEAILAKCCPEH